MKRFTKLSATGMALACGAAATHTAEAAGIMLYEFATPDVGLASAGYAARADDASTLFTNPAGMSQLDGGQFQGGLQALYGSVSFAPGADSSNRLGTNGGGNSVGWLPAGSAFVVMPIGEKWRVGLGTLSYFGLATEYDDNWVGRYYVQNSALLGMTVMPTVSYQVNDWLSVGAGLNAMFGYLDTEMAVNNGIGADGQMSLQDETWGVGGNFGVLVRAGEKTRIGLNYLSAVKLDFGATPEFSGLGPVLGPVLANPSQINLGMKVPQTAMLSTVYDLNAQWSLMADFGWQNWSQFGYVQAGVESGGTTTLDLEYQDTFHGAIGARFQATENLRLTGGAAYDSSAVKDENRTVTLPMGEAWRLGVGAQYQVSKSINVGAAYTFMWAGDMSVDQGSDLALRGRVAGEYEDAWFNFINLNLTWKF